MQNVITSCTIYYLRVNKYQGSSRSDLQVALDSNLSLEAIQNGKREKRCIPDCFLWRVHEVALKDCLRCLESGSGAKVSSMVSFNR
jgi:hypothetical protein